MRKISFEYYLITCQFGHQGSGKSETITFNIKAKNISEALDKAKHMPGVKHDKNTVIVNVKKITEEEYIENMNESAYRKFQKHTLIHLTFSS